jgi:hypothetical protein
MSIDIINVVVAVQNLYVGYEDCKAYKFLQYA